MSVLRYGFPNRESLRCDNPVCDELAQHCMILTETNTKGDPVLVFACNTHNAQLQVGRPIKRVERLKVAGERNLPTLPPMPADQDDEEEA
jgi:hypothetical protein